MPTPTFQEFATEFMRSGGRRPANQVKALREHVVPALGAYTLDAITEDVVLDVAREWLDHAAVESVRLRLSVLYDCLDAAVQAGLLSVNPVRRPVRPARTKHAPAMGRATRRMAVGE